MKSYGVKWAVKGADDDIVMDSKKIWQKYGNQ